MRRRAVVQSALSAAALLFAPACSGGGTGLAGALAAPGPPDDASQSRAQAQRRAASLAFSAVSPHARPAIAFGSPSFGGPATGKGEAHAVLVTNDDRNDVEVYSLTGAPEISIDGFNLPQGLAVDPAGNVYVANTLSSNIPVYKSDDKTLLRTLSDPGQGPADVAYDAKTGLIGAANILTITGGPGSVSFWAKGQLTPCVTVSGPSFAKVYAGAFDASGNFFVDGLDQNSTTVVGVVTGGCKATTIRQLTVANDIAFPGGVAISPAGNLLILDQDALTVDTYKPALSGSLGMPIAQTFLTGVSTPVYVALTTTGNNLWSSDFGSGSVPEFHYPKGGFRFAQVDPEVETVGIAVTPAETP